MNIFVIGDIHGCLNQLISIHNKIFNYANYKKEEDLLVYLGDYIDRGPKSKQVVDQMLNLKNEGIKTTFNAAYNNCLSESISCVLSPENFHH